MITPQQIEQISFSKATFGGYNMEQVDEILEPLTEDYVKLYKENALLKSKMRVLVTKLEEYRKNESSVADATAGAKQTADRMIREAEAKCAQMLQQAKAQAAAQESAPAAAETAPAAAAGSSAEALIAVEKIRVAEARKAAAARITEIQSQMQSCIQALDRIKNANVAPAGTAASAPAPAPAPAPVPAKVEKPADTYDSDAVVNEISQNLEAMVGTTTETAPKAAPAHPVQDTTTSRFTNLNLQFGRNYDPTHK